MRLLVTGCLGHIGSRFIHSLRPGELEDVILLDNLSTQRYCSLFNLPAGVRFRFVEADICTADLGALMVGVDTVVHLAAITDATSSFAIREQVERVNLEGTRRVAAACAASGARLFFPSTTSVYGTQKEVVDESCADEDLKPQSPYADSKLAAERLLQALGRELGLRFVVCRFGTIFGTSMGMRFHTAINKFCWQACVGAPITVWRTALDQRRPYLDLGDAVAAMRFMLERDQFDGQVYNVVTANATVSEIVALISSLVPDLAVELVDSPIMNQLSYTVAADRIGALGFVPAGRLADGIRDTVAWLRNVRAHPTAPPAPDQR